MTLLSIQQQINLLSVAIQKFQPSVLFFSTCWSFVSTAAFFFSCFDSFFTVLRGHFNKLLKQAAGSIWPNVA